VLADPVFSERCSPFSFLGPKRYTPVPCQIDDLPHIDAVIISHNHYDHLDYPTIMQIYKAQPNVHFIVPLKLKKWFVDCKINPSQVTEMDWWEEATLTVSKIGGNETKVSTPQKSTTPNAITAKFACLPSQHMGNRSPFDRGAALWASWSIESGGKKLYFAGDTGYRGVTKVPDGEDDYGSKYDDLAKCPAFEQIGKHYGPFDLGLIPIGAYSPRNIMSPMHSNTMDAVHIFRDTKCKKALAKHWGTWILTDEPVLEPPKQLKESLSRQGLPETGVFDVVDIGESREFV
jgi:N-acyl-phosphatidylethanolamine-hydrolysing phospholipase D